MGPVDVMNTQLAEFERGRDYISWKPSSNSEPRGQLFGNTGLSQIKTECIQDGQTKTDRFHFRLCPNHTNSSPILATRAPSPTRRSRQDVGLIPTRNGHSEPLFQSEIASRTSLWDHSGAVLALKTCHCAANQLDPACFASGRNESSDGWTLYVRGCFHQSCSNLHQGIQSVVYIVHCSVIP